ncbi:MAG: hypothetical protein C0601_12985 [Candidatus Muiribacterium halophilum]|uniref:Bacterial sugar transferase domain-containing protein n=1 Tax=Muiribacterium halophilum TaxID=2053465 RepID=A0A2N5Z9S5_MUIH1|nr:MAG: hypothetical protein C0601_12985 [Candidatus Muirbacterium halophilum]
MRRYIFRLLLLITDIVAYFISFFIVFFCFSKTTLKFDYTPNLLILNLVIFIVFMFIEETYSLREEDFIKRSFYIAKGVFLSFIISLLFLYNVKNNLYPIIFIFLWYLGLFFIVVNLRLIMEKIVIRFNVYFRKTLLILTDNSDKKDFLDIFGRGKNKVNRVCSVLKPDVVLDMSEEDINDHIKKKGISQVIIFSRKIGFDDLMKVEEKFEGKVYFIKVVPDITQLQLAEMEVMYINERLVLENRQKLLSPYRKLLKRIMDIILSFIFIILFSPIMFITAVLIKLESRGPIFFCQNRLGKDKKSFKVIKFRSMFIDAEERLERMIAEDEKIRKEYGKYAKLKNDPRITKVGKVIRKLSIDELPQFFNVFLGHMSVMGPRPYLLSELDKMGSKANTILASKPGITGLWQIRGRNALTFDERVQLESFYIKNWSLWLDIVILAVTPYVVIFKRKTG